MNARILPRRCRKMQALAKRFALGDVIHPDQYEAAADRYYHCGQCRHSKIRWTPQAVYIPASIEHPVPEAGFAW